jgi:hypothetical protein
MLQRKLGIYMDHLHANLLDLTTGTMQTSHKGSTFTHEEKEDTLQKSENLMHHAEQHEEAAYYKQLGEIILQYNDVLLFGQTQAKTELYNTLKDNHLFSKIKIAVKPSDRLTPNQQEAFVRNYFTKELS